MALSRQLFLLISLLFLMIFVVNYATGVNNTRNYLQTEARIHAEDTAVSLGISLSPYIKDPRDTIIPTLINAVFDRGYYGSIILRDFDGQILIERTNPKTFLEVPDWFTRTLPLETASAVSEINDGWNLAAEVVVTVHPGYAYLKLWQQAKRALTYSAAAYLVSMIILGLVLRQVLRPLEKIERQAAAIGEGEYATIDPLPWTKELRHVAVAMNKMAGKIKQVIDGLQSKLGDAERKISTDAVTGLKTRQSFDAAMKQMFVAGGSGHVFLIRVDNLAELARSRVNDEVDRFLKEFADCLKAAGGDQADVHAYRLGGGEFAVIADSLDRQQAGQRCRELSDRLAELGRSIGREGVAHIGGIAFDPLGTTQTIMSAALESYNKARLIGRNSYVIGQKSAGARSKDEWVELVRSVVENSLAEIVISDQALALQGDETGAILLEEATAGLKSGDGEDISIGTFISVAEEIDLATGFDLMILKKVIAWLGAEDSEHDVGVNLSFSSIGDPDFRSQLYGLIEDNKTIATRLVFCLTAYSAAKDLSLLESFKDLLRRQGSKLMIKRYEPRFMELDVLKQCRFDYIRLARSFTERLSGDAEKMSLVASMVETGHLLDTTILAESVSENDWQQVVDLGVEGASRRNT